MFEVPHVQMSEQQSTDSTPASPSELETGDTVAEAAVKEEAVNQGAEVSFQELTYMLNGVPGARGGARGHRNDSGSDGGSEASGRLC